MLDFTDEAHCFLCSLMWPGERPGLSRESRHDTDKPICNRCLMAWARNVGFPVSDDDATEN